MDELSRPFSSITKETIIICCLRAICVFFRIKNCLHGTVHCNRAWKSMVRGMRIHFFTQFVFGPRFSRAIASNKNITQTRVSKALAKIITLRSSSNSRRTRFFFSWWSAVKSEQKFNVQHTAFGTPVHLII